MVHVGLAMHKMKWSDYERARAKANIVPAAAPITKHRASMYHKPPEWFEIDISRRSRGREI